MYNYIDSGKMTIRNIDLRRKTGYRQRRKNSKDARAGVKALTDQSYRIGRTYEDFEADMKYFSDFTGEGAVLVSKDRKIILTDGRYMTSAKRETEGLERCNSHSAVAP